MCEPQIFQKHMYCFEESICDISVPRGFCPLITPLVVRATAFLIYKHEVFILGRITVCFLMFSISDYFM